MQNCYSRSSHCRHRPRADSCLCFDQSQMALRLHTLHLRLLISDVFNASIQATKVAVDDAGMSLVATKNDNDVAFRQRLDECKELMEYASEELSESSRIVGDQINNTDLGKAAKLEKLKDAKLAWLLDKYYYRSQESVGCSSSHANLYLTEKELYLDEEALRETLEEQAIDAKTREEKIRQKQADDDELFLTFGRVRIDSDYESSD
ncbi:hypothetical protein Tco_0994430 [Tanacetum coccineum]